jgi:hypothetical protein
MIPIAAVLGLLLLSSFAATVSAADNNQYLISFTGDQYLGTGETGRYTVQVTAGPGGNYSYSVKVNGGAKVVPANGQSSTENFTVSVTAPTTPQDVVMEVNISSIGATPSVNTTAKYTIHVIKPVKISAVVQNTANVTANNVPIEFWADGKLVNSTTFNVGANSNKTVTYNWTAPNLAAGQHTLQVKLDPNSQYVTFSDGSTTFTSYFYIGDGGWGLINILLIIIFALLLVIVFLTYMGRNKKRKK